MKLSWFKDEQGSTSLTVVLGIVLSVVLVASSVQWYWTHSTSSDIQTVADISALAAADVTAQSVMFVQMLDAMLLSANLFSLLVSAIAVISGILAVFLGPYLGPSLASFSTKAANFNIKFGERRRKFAKDAHKVAEGVSALTPLLAVAQAYRVGAENSAHLQAYNGTAYMAVAIPFPAKGSVELNGFSSKEEEMQKKISEASEKNWESAEAAKQLEDEVERARRACFDANVYLPAGTSFVHWSPLQAIDDYSRAWSELAGQSAPSKNLVSPLDANNSSHLSAHQENYRAYYQQIASSVRSDLDSIFSTAKSSKAGNIKDISVSSLLSKELNARVYFANRDSGGRRAYHKSSDCWTIRNQDYAITSASMRELIGDSNHPPCLQCKPQHWQALEVWQEQLTKFSQEWGPEATALRRWFATESQLQSEKENLQDNTSEAFELLKDQASLVLKGGRLHYTPAGARGYLTLVVATSERELPAFTLPALTNSQDIALGRQVAFSAARLMPSKTESTIPQLLSDSHKAAEKGGGDGISNLMLELVTEEGSNTASVSSAGRFLLQLWGSSLALYGDGVDGLRGLISGLPFGLDAELASVFDDVLEAANLDPPDLRRPVPTLVNTADVGDANARGYEAAIVKSIASGKSVLEVSGGASLPGLRENISGVINDLESDVARQISDLMKLDVLGVQVPLPFSQPLIDLTARAFAVIRSKEDELFAVLKGF